MVQPVNCMFGICCARDGVLFNGGGGGGGWPRSRSP